MYFVVWIDLFCCLKLKQMSSQTLYREDSAHSPRPPKRNWFLPSLLTLFSTARCVSIKCLVRSQKLVPNCNQNIFYSLESEDGEKLEIGIDNHHSDLLSLVVSVFHKIRLHHIAKLASFELQKGSRKNKLCQTVLFQGFNPTQICILNFTPNS